MKILIKLRFVIPWIPFLGLLYIVIASDVLKNIDYRKAVSEPEGFSFKLFLFGTRNKYVLWLWAAYQIAYLSFIFNLS